MQTLVLVPARLALADLRRLWSESMVLVVDSAAKPAVDAAARSVDRVIASIGSSASVRLRINPPRVTMACHRPPSGHSRCQSFRPEPREYPDTAPG